jgi:hypothetical protein
MDKTPRTPRPNACGATLMSPEWIPEVEESDSSFPIWTIDGEKGTGKTGTYLDFPYPSGLAFSFDYKVNRILQQRPERKEHWRVIDALAYYDVGESVITASGARTHDYLLQVLRTYDPDPRVRATIPKERWREPVNMVVFDGIEMLSEVEEMRMRARHNLKPFEAFSQRGYWKTRRLGVRELIRAAQRACARPAGEPRALTFVTYPKRIDIVKDGVLIETREPPNWYDMIEKETDLWLRCQRTEDPIKGAKFFVTVMTSKFKSFPEKRYEVTGKSFTDVVGRQAFLSLDHIESPVNLPSDLRPLPPGARVVEPGEVAAPTVGDAGEDTGTEPAAASDDAELDAFLKGE